VRPGEGANIHYAGTLPMKPEGGDLTCDRDGRLRACRSVYLADGSVFFADQRLSREQALQSYTLNNAYAAFEEDLKGSLTPGKLADVVVLSKDIMTIPEDEIPTAEVLYTIVGGEVLYEQDEME